MIVNLARIFALVCLAVAITFAQIDRASREKRELSFVVPSMFSAESSRYRANIAVQAGRSAAALAEARTQVRLRPMPAEGLSLLFLAAASQDNQNVAIAAMNAASRRGWREPLAQLASGQSALQQGRYDIAAQRIVALLSTARLPNETMALLAELVSQPLGRQAFAARLVEHGGWQNGVLVAAADSIAIEDWADTIEIAQGLGFSAACDRLGILQRSYENRGEEFVLEQIEAGRCVLRRRSISPESA